jgi:hypothetical protein
MVFLMCALSSSSVGLFLQLTSITENSVMVNMTGDLSMILFFPVYSVAMVTNSIKRQNLSDGGYFYSDPEYFKKVCSHTIIRSGIM